jgi:hypothetical protein
MRDGLVIVPIDNHVHTEFDGVGHDLLDLGAGVFGVDQIRGTVVSGLHSHRGSNQREVPRIPHVAKAISVFGKTVFLPVEPHAAHTLELYGITTFADELSPRDPQLTISMHRAVDRRIARNDGSGGFVGIR